MVRRGGIFSISVAFTAGTVAASMVSATVQDTFQDMTSTEYCNTGQTAAGLAAASGPMLPTAAFIILMLMSAAPQSRTAAMHIIFAAAGFTSYISARTAENTLEGYRTSVEHTCRKSCTERIRDMLSARLQDAMEEGVPGKDTRTTAAIATAMVTGDRRGITEETESNFSASGTMHLLALSGLHMGIIGGLVTAALTFVPRTRRWNPARNILTAACVWAYTAVTGAAVSTVRAAIFLTFRLAAQTWHRECRGHDILALTTVTVLSCDPTQIDDLGFQMSYGAVFGITVILPNLKPYTEFRNPILRRTAESVAVTLICQLTSGTIAMYRFGTFSPLFLAANILAVPLATPTILLSVLLVAAADIPAARTVLANMLHFTVSLMDMITSGLGHE